MHKNNNINIFLFKSTQLIITSDLSPENLYTVIHISEYAHDTLMFTSV